MFGGCRVFAEAEEAAFAEDAADAEAAAAEAAAHAERARSRRMFFEDAEVEDGDVMSLWVYPGFRD